MRGGLGDGGGAVPGKQSWLHGLCGGGPGKPCTALNEPSHTLILAVGKTIDTFKAAGAQVEDTEVGGAGGAEGDEALTKEGR